jgi:hypothetical protein
MSRVWQAAVEGKGHELQSQLEEWQGFSRTAVATGLAVHEVEPGLFKRLLELGYELQRWFLAWLGDGDPGETVTPGEGGGLRRLPRPHRRPSQSILGRFERERVVYGTCARHWIESVPLEACWGLAGGKVSYLRPEGDQGLAGESPSQQVNRVVQRRWGLEPSVASLEQMRRTLAEAVEGVGAEQSPVPPARAEQLGVLSAEGQGVPRRKPAATAPMAAHQPPKGLKPGRKQRAGVGAVYPMDRYRRTPEDVVEA